MDEHLIALGITPEVEKQLTTVVPASDVMPRSWLRIEPPRGKAAGDGKGEEIQSDHDFSAMQRRWARRATASLAEAPEAGRFRGIAVAVGFEQAHVVGDEPQHTCPVLSGSSADTCWAFG